MHGISNAMNSNACNIMITVIIVPPNFFDILSLYLWRVL